jgi:ATP-binding cassette, subfamily B, bacterial
VTRKNRRRSSSARHDGSSDLKLYRLLASHVRPYWRHLIGVLVLTLLATPLALLAPVPLKVAIDSGLGSHPVPGFLQPLLGSGSNDSRVLYGAAALLAAVALLAALQVLTLNLLRAYTGEQLVFDLRTRLFNHAQRLSLSYHDVRGTADSLYRVHYDAQSIRYLAVDGLIPFVGAGFTVAGMLYVTARIDWQLALVALAVSPVLFAIARSFRVRLRRGAHGVKALESNALGVVQQTLTQMRVVRVFGQEAREHARFAQRSREGIRARLRLVRSEEIFGVLVAAVTALGTAAVLLIGATHVRSGALTLGSLLLVLGYLSELYDPLRAMSKQLTAVQDSHASAERVFALLAEPEDVEERPDARPLLRASGNLRFDDVSFAFTNSSPTLDTVSFEIPAGSRVGIEGTTGAGKTTLVSLIARLYDPTAGRILLDGVDLRDYRVADLRRQIAVVLQEPVLFAASIGENIAYARPDADEQQIVAAAKAACAHDFISALPDGYDTLVGERGMTLSGGERQRLSLARAFLKDAPILILDEPTSALDSATERQLFEAQERVMKDRTSIVVAHRPQLLERCDLRVRIERGRVVDVRPRPVASRSVRSRERRSVPAEVVRSAPSEVSALASRVVSRSARSLVRDEALKRSVHRMWFDVEGDNDSVIVKRLSRRRARLNHLVARRWLPAVELEWICPKVLAGVRDRDPHWIWQIYEDVGGSELATEHADRAHVTAVVDVIAELHTRFAGHPVLSHCRGVADDLGMPFFNIHVTRARRYLRWIDVRASDEHARVRDALVARIDRLYAERHARARQLERCRLPITLLHGDLWTTNTLIVDDVRCPSRLIDWDHAGVGPLTYDLSTFLYRFPSGDRSWILARYRDAVSVAGWELPADQELNEAFATAEYARYASCLAEAAFAGVRGEAWAYEQLTEIERWFSALQPVLNCEGSTPLGTSDAR